VKHSASGGLHKAKADRSSGNYLTSLGSNAYTYIPPEQSRLNYPNNLT
jgi:hypothetical protein